MKKTESEFNDENRIFGFFLSKENMVKKFYKNVAPFDKLSNGGWETTRKTREIKLWITLAFVWRETSEGFGFWQEINNKFLTYLNTKK